MATPIEPRPAAEPDDTVSDAEAALCAELARGGFGLVPAAAMRPLLGPTTALSDWLHFADSWNDLYLDAYLPDGHRYRRRRHATFSARAGEEARPEPHRPHYQGLEYNPLVGGIERRFEPIVPQIVAGPTLRHLLAFGCRLFGALRPDSDWHIECHQFRIEARRDAPGLRTPEGVHRDGVDYVLVLLVNRSNIASGTTTVHDLDGKLLGSFTLTEAFDTALVDDARVKHGVTPVTAIDPDCPAYRDVLVITFRARPNA